MHQVTQTNTPTYLNALAYQGPGNTDRDNQELSKAQRQRNLADSSAERSKYFLKGQTDEIWEEPKTQAKNLDDAMKSHFLTPQLKGLSTNHNI